MRAAKLTVSLRGDRGNGALSGVLADEDMGGDARNRLQSCLIGNHDWLTDRAAWEQQCMSCKMNKGECTASEAPSVPMPEHELMT
eukprot:1137379-Pelagomonas_calceolata.AAC.3